MKAFVQLVRGQATYRAKGGDEEEPGEMNQWQLPAEVRSDEVEEIGIWYVKERAVCAAVRLHSSVLKVAGLAQIRRERDDV